MSQVIEIIISPGGQTRLQTTGYTGNSCREASRFLELALGQRGGEQLTAEFFQPVTEHRIQQSRNHTQQ
jgi:hypothetical protein